MRHHFRLGGVHSLLKTRTYKEVGVDTYLRRASGWWCQSWHVGVALVVGISSAIVLRGENALAQIQADTTLGVEQTLVQPLGNGVFQIDGGATRGTNLFHSFQEFSVPTNGLAFFNNLSNIQNIISRVTGSFTSNIDGTLQTLGNANLYLINPNGIIFGANARLQLGGSFVTTTANAIEFEGGIFSASVPSVPPATLTVNPSAFLFNQLAAQPIINSSMVADQSIPVGLRSGDSKSLVLLGGDVILDNGGFLTAAGGRVEIGGVAGAGRVELDSNLDGSNLSLIFPDDVTRANVSLRNGAAVNVAAVANSNDVAGGIFIQAGSIFLQDSSQLSSSTFETGDAGSVFLQATNVVALTNGSTIFSTGEQGSSGDAGLISIDARAVVLNGAFLTTNNQGSGTAGSIDIRARDLISVENKSEITSEGNNTNTSDFGFIRLTAIEGSVLLNNSKVSTTNSGSGYAGDIVISARNQFSAVNQSEVSSEGNLGRIFIGNSDVYDQSISPSIVTVDNSTLSTNNEGSSGRAGDIRIAAIDDVSIANNSRIFSNTLGETKAGNISVYSEGSVSLTSGALLSTSTLGRGNAGIVTVEAMGLVSIDNSGLLSDVGETGVGDAGGIGIQASSLFITNGATLTTETRGIGNAGLILLQVDGDVTLSRGAILTTQTFGTGNSGIVLIDAGGDVSISGNGSGLGGTTGIFSTVEENARGSALGISISARSLFMDGGANIQALTRGEGNAGIIVIDTSDSVNLSGVNPDGFSTGLFSSTEDTASGPGGLIAINTGTLRLADAAVVSARTRNALPGGAIGINVHRLEATNGGQVLTTAFGSGRAGDISIAASDRITLSGRDPTFTDRFNQTLAQYGPVLGPQIFDNVALGASGVFANTAADSTAIGGNLDIFTRDLLVRNEAQIAVNNEGLGPAGNINISADRDLFVRDRGLISATTRSGEGGNMNIGVGELLVLTDNSNISTTAGTANAGGNGGNINIKAPYIFAAPVRNSNITAQAFTGDGGDILIDAAQLYRIAPRPEVPRTNDISASSEYGRSGEVTANVLNVDPTQGLTNLPQAPVDVSRQIRQRCAVRTPDSAQVNKFTITGRGGLPSNPADTLQNESVLTNWVTSDPQVGDNNENDASTHPDRTVSPSSSQSKAPELVEAQGWIYGKNGEVILTARTANITPHSSSLTPAASCNAY